MSRKKMVKLGAVVSTTEGCREGGNDWVGVVVGFTRYRSYDAVMVKKTGGRTVRCLKKNLEVVE